jgi:hypothetical protein
VAHSGWGVGAASGGGLAPAAKGRVRVGHVGGIRHRQLATIEEVRGVRPAASGGRGRSSRCRRGRRAEELMTWKRSSDGGAHNKEEVIGRRSL